MRKVVVFLLIMLTCVTSFANGKGIFDLNGTDWVTWNRTTKEVFLIGFISAHYGVYNYVVEKDKSLSEWLVFAEDFSMVCSRLDIFYSFKKNIDIPVWQAIYLIYRKAWWVKQPQGDVG